MEEFTKLTKVVDYLIKKYFTGKVDKGGNDYIIHLKTVADSVSKLNGGYFNPFGLNCYITAYLHDILEDTECTVEELRENELNEDIINAVVAITRQKDESYYNFIKRLKKNDIARIVKICDLEHNMDIRRLNKFGKYELNRLHKYWYSWKYLKDEITDNKYLDSMIKRVEYER